MNPFRPKMAEERKDSKWVLWIVVACILLIVGVIAYLYEPSYHWNRHAYLDGDDEPYDIDLFYNYLNAQRADDMIKADSAISSNLNKVDSTEVNADYMVLGYLPYLDSADVEDLFDFVERGNQAFLLTGAPNKEILARLHASECVIYEPYYEDYGYDYLNVPNSIPDSIVYADFIDPRLKLDSAIRFEHRVQADLKPFPWVHFDSLYLCEVNRSFEGLATVNGHVNFVRASYGEGHFYLHTTPKFFGNYYLTRPEGQAYVERVMAYMGEGPVIWDRKEWNRAIDRQYYENGYQRFDGPLSYILSQESLRWALYCLFAGVALFLLLGSRRQQRAIPVKTKKENSSLQYVDTVTDLYFGQKGDGRIFKYISEQFQFFIRKRYRFQLQWKEDKDWTRLAKASGVKPEQLEKIRSTQSKGAYEGNVDQTMLAEYYSAMDHFYTHCK